MNSLEKERSHTLAPDSTPFVPSMLDSDWKIAPEGWYGLIAADDTSGRDTIYAQIKPATFTGPDCIRLIQTEHIAPQVLAAIWQSAFENALLYRRGQTAERLAYTIQKDDDFPHTDAGSYWLGEMDSQVAGSLSARSVFRPIIAPLKRKAVLDDIVRELGRLDDGWAGEGSVRPKSSIILDIQRFAISLPSGTVEPETEIDEEDGYVSLRWTAPKLKSSLTVLFLGERDIILTYNSLTNQEPPSRKLKVDNTVELASALNQPDFFAVLTEHGVQ